MSTLTKAELKQRNTERGEYHKVLFVQFIDLLIEAVQANEPARILKFKQGLINSFNAKTDTATNALNKLLGDD